MHNSCKDLAKSLLDNRMCDSCFYSKIRIELSCVRHEDFYFNPPENNTCESWVGYKSIDLDVNSFVVTTKSDLEILIKAIEGEKYVTKVCSSKES